MNLLSVVVPFYNEGEALFELHKQLTGCLDALQVPYEIILVDDGSTDSSLEIARGFCKGQNIKIISFSRNFGQQSAISAGLKHVQGDAVVIMDADLQDPPELIEKFLDSFNMGYDVVYGIRTKRKENIFKRLTYKIYYRLLRATATLPLPVDSGDFCLISRKAADILNALPERNRYIRGLRAWLGFSQLGIAYERKKRCQGETKYTLKKMLRIAFDGIVAFSRTPYQFFAISGSLISLLSVLIGFGMLLSGVTSVIAWALIGLLFLNGLQCLGLGLIGESVWHITQEAKGRPDYIIRETLGFNDDSSH